MINHRQKVEAFLKKYSFDVKGINIGENCRMFIEEMEKGLRGEASSLAMITSYISVDKKIPENERVIVLDAGGTNFRAATCYFDGNGKPVIEDFSSYPMPGTHGEISRDEFFGTMARYIEPVIDKSDKIGFCFSYATKAQPNKDGKVLQLSKEIKVRDLIGELVGEGLLAVVKNMGKAKKHIVVLNDTVATLLGGKAAYPERVFESYVGFILGTGTNTSYTEEKANIKKDPELAGEKGLTVINMESGGYQRAPGSIIDKEFDALTLNPGEYNFEKMISGRYQGELVAAFIKKASEEGLLSKGFGEKIKGWGEIDAKDINDFLYYPYSKSKLSCTGDDPIVVYHIIDAILERAAKLVAINLSAVLIKTGAGKNPCKPVCVCADGSAFYKLKSLRSKLDYYIKDYLNEQKGLYCEFIKADNAPLIGAAIAGLTN